MDDPQPHYQRLKTFVVREIETGRLRPGDRIPSELDLMKQFQVSRMTANRALRELQQAGAVSRIQGVGTFVSARTTEQAHVDIHNIASAIRESKQSYACRVVYFGTEAEPDICQAMGLLSASQYGRVKLLHLADGIPVQHEDRCVNLAFAPAFLDQDFSRTTPYEYLMSLGPLQAAEQVFEVARLGVELAALFEMQASLPCLVLRRRTWSFDLVASTASITAPSNRYRFHGATGMAPDSARQLPRL
ncbi:UTRA domain-containing protein [Acidisoma silvae]|uniref:UTRA domain-containing protein n=1 Tax=Acidisoma silvae TaxID=2802396 RepID=A0A963YVB2_9PROT|nr:UTRA domain-containing protein [Acidisoma silvae]MCB8877481.1 UTRA domain-containing protein [Acidisoma silvae]